MEHEREREGRIADEQKIAMIEFMEEHSDFARGKFTGNEGRRTVLSLWEALAAWLNSLDGPKKSTAKWKRVWIDLRNKTKRKANEVRALRLRTGGDIVLSEIDERIISIMSEEAVYGLTMINGTVLESDEQLPPSTSSTIAVASTRLTTSKTSTSCLNPVASTSSANSVDSTSRAVPSEIISVSPPSSFFDHLEYLGSDDSSVTSDSEVKGNDKEISSQHTNKRKKKQNLLQVCLENSESMNNKMDRLIDIMNILVEEKKKQTAIMEEMIKLKKIKYSKV